MLRHRFLKRFHSVMLLKKLVQQHRVYGIIAPHVEKAFVRTPFLWGPECQHNLTKAGLTFSTWDGDAETIGRYGWHMLSTPDQTAVATTALRAFSPAN